MVRKLILAVVMLAMAAVPIPALARDGGHGFNSAPRFHGRHEFVLRRSVLLSEEVARRRQ